jgi:6-pyruvoyltetrahydropterin/6-carboxytetrahydropterin synthase
MNRPKFYSTKTYGHELGLSACFRQWRADSHCNLLHGYALSIKLVFEAYQLDDRNWVMDFGGLKAVKKLLEDTFDHKLLVARDDPHLDTLTGLAGLGLADCVVLPAVGCEAFAQYIYQMVSVWMRTQKGTGGVLLRSVEVREHGANSAIFEAAQ